LLRERVQLLIKMAYFKKGHKWKSKGTCLLLNAI
jgi:hypothetical protein